MRCINNGPAPDRVRRLSMPCIVDSWHASKQNGKQHRNLYLPVNRGAGHSANMVMGRMAFRGPWKLIEAKNNWRKLHSIRRACGTSLAPNGHVVPPGTKQ